MSEEMKPAWEDAQESLQRISDAVLGEDWYVVDPLSQDQVNVIQRSEIIAKFKEQEQAISFLGMYIVGQFAVIMALLIILFIKSYGC